MLARGGLGGVGNQRFATPTEQAPRLAEVGQAGEEGTYELRLKLLADAAFLGFPNAGKSSLLRRISNAKPKVAEYPFTTIAPVLGTVDSPDGRQLTVADVPGLLEGASEGVGLGHEFLAHLERARLFLHVIDVTEDVDERFHAIDRELAAYGAGLAERPQIVVLNKIDLVAEPPDVRAGRPARRGGRPGLGGDRRRDRRAAASALRLRVGRVAGGRLEAGARRRRRRARGLPRLPPAAAAAAAVPDLPRRRRLPRHRPRGGGARRGRAARGAAPRGREARRRGHGRRADVRVRVTVGLLGGTFDPPHLGHVALARRALDELDLERLLVVVVGEAPHKAVATDAETRFRLAEAAFGGSPRRRALAPRARAARPVVHRGHGALGGGALRRRRSFIVGADEFADFPAWKEPDAILEHVRLAVATRPGTSHDRIEAAAQLARPDRVVGSTSSRSRSRPATCGPGSPAASRSTTSSRRRSHV